MIRRIVILLLVAGSAAFIVLVQRDSFVRRWVIREPSAPNKLQHLLPRVDFEGLTLRQATEELSRLAAVPIDVDDEVIKADVAGWGGLPPPEWRLYRMQLNHVTLERALELLLATPMDDGTQLVAVPAGDRIRIITTDAADAELVTRAYDLSPLLPPPGPKKVSPASIYMQQQTTPLPMSDREQAMESILDLVEHLCPNSPTSSTPSRGTGGLFGNTSRRRPGILLDTRMIVIASPVGHARLNYALQHMRR